jgi:putative transposase
MSDWPHAPVHRFGDAGVYFVTGATLYKQHFFADSRSLDALQMLLFEKANEYAVALQAWCLFPNHYHLVATADEGARLKQMLVRFYVDSAKAVNQRDGIKGRRVWYQFRDTQLTYERSWLARLKYTHENAVHHGVVADAMDYRWCSASWFAATARPAFVETIRRVKLDRIAIYDDYDVPLGVR